MNINQLLEETIRRKASDLHITAGVPPMLRIDGNLQPLGEVVLTLKTPGDSSRPYWMKNNNSSLMSGTGRLLLFRFGDGSF